MQDLEQVQLPKFTPDELERMSEALADALVRESAQTDLSQITQVFEYDIIKEAEIAEVISLDLISSATAGVWDVVGQLKSYISSIVNSIASWIVSGLKSFIDSIIDWLWDRINSLVSGVSSLISNSVLPAISGIISSISNIISLSVLPAIGAVTPTISNLLSTSVLPAITAVASGISDLISESVLPAITTILTAVSELITGSVLPLITEAFTSISNLISTSILPAITTGLTNIVDFMGSQVIPALTGGLATLSAFLDTYVVKPIYEIGSIVATGFAQLGAVTMGFINAILQFPQWFPTWFWTYLGKPIQDALTNLATWIWQALPDWLKDALTATQTFFENVWEGLQNFISDPLRWLNENLVTPFMEGFDLLIQAIPPLKLSADFIVSPILFAQDYFDSVWDAVQWIGNQVVSDWQTSASWMATSVEEIANFLGTLLLNTTQSIWGTASKVSAPLEQFIRPLYKPVATNTANLMSGHMTPLFTDMFKEFQIGTPKIFEKSYVQDQLFKAQVFSITAMTMPFWGQLPLRLTAWTTKAIAKWAGGLDWKVQIDLRPFGVGVATEFDMAKALGASLWTSANEMMKYLEELGKGMMYGYAIWLSRPMTRLMSYHFRNIIPVEIPDENIIIEFARRTLGYSYERDATGKLTKVEPTKFFKDSLNIGKFYYALYGFSDESLRWMFSYDLKDWVQVQDRFGYVRNFPISLMHELPSASDMATMMVKDLFYDIDSFKKVAQMRGMTEDIACMYYFLRFRYPPPEQLWKFTARGISGLLWATVTTEELKDIKEEADAIGAFLPKSPTDFNFEAEPLMSAFKTYMKWHDFGKFSWIKDFPSDNLIYIDTLADIPTKIDQRWMTKWALYELLSSKGVELKSPISEFRTKIVEGEAKSDVTMDLTLFSRTLQATGIHPDWIPLTAVAEAMNTLTEERTGLRTGFKNLFKEGFWDIKSLETLLAGIVTASFKVSYFDSEEMEWGTGWVNQPVMFLPAERKLIELRALMDRAFDVLRETQRDVSKGYEEWIIDTYDEYKSRLTGIITKINEFFTADYKEITGAELPQDLQLQFVEAYYKPYVESLDIWRDVYTIRRVRYWTQRWLGWIMYRVATGTVRKEDIDELVEYVGEKAKLTAYETDFINGVIDLMYGITVREYAPTPSQLATLSGYMVISQTLIDRALETRLIPAEWKPIWNQYINVRPIASDVKSLISTYRRALLYAVIPDEIKTKVLSYATLIGFTDREFEILALRNQLEELILDARESKKEYVPTMSMLASMSEYIPRIREFFDEVVTAKHIPPAWVPIWADYVDLKPIINEIKKMVSRSEDLYVYFMITEADFKNVLDQVAFIGYTPTEIEYILSNARLERHHRAWTELIGDVDRMTMLAEYSPRARNFALGQLYKMIDALPIALETKAVLKEMWEQFIRLKPIMDEVRRYVTELISLYADGLVSDLDFTSELEALKPWGLDDYEIMFYHAIAGMRRARKLKIPVG